MGKKEARRRKNSLRPLSGIRNLLKSFFGFSNYSIGFTLVELLVVISVLSIIGTGVIVLLNPAEQIKKANDSKRKSDLSQIQRTLEIYYNDNGKYPAHNTTAVSPGCPKATDIYRINPPTGCQNWGSQWEQYKTTLPKDPKSSRSYAYWASSDGQSYALYTSLERASLDSQACSSIPCTNASSRVTVNGCGTGICNYGATSSNISP